MTSAETKRQTLNPRNQPAPCSFCLLWALLSHLFAYVTESLGVCSGLQTPTLLVTAVKTACLPCPTSG